MSDANISPELITIYVEDARGHLEALDHCLLTLERDGFDREVISAVLGPLHTLKGNSGMMGFGAVKDYVHRLEDVFAKVNEGVVRLEPGVFDRLFAGASALREAIEKASEAGHEVRDLKAEIADLNALLMDSGLAAEKAYPKASGESPREDAAAPMGPEGAMAPTPAARDLKRGSDVQYVAARTNTLRVDFAKLDHLLNLVGELIIYRTKLQQLGKQLAESIGARGPGQELLAAVGQVAGVSAQLQETVMQVRMLPMRQVFERFPRMVRDLSRQQGKEIELIIEGEATRVDKAIIDEIGEPLVHMIRNSVDHGIEVPRERIVRGKTPTGTILLSAAQESNHVLITIMDDGNGIDVDMVRKKGVERGLIKADDRLSEREILQLIFTRGFSTSERVTEVSGRGVGMDVVLQAIEHLNGLIEVESVPGVGAKFIIQLPLTLAIISTLLVEVCGHMYAIPLSTVVESLKFAPKDIQRIHGRDTLRVRDHIVPLLRLADLFGFERPPAQGSQYVVILGRRDHQVGLVVDQLKGQQEVVIKALDPTVTTGASAVAGATIMGDGRVVLILDVASLFEGGRRALVHGRTELMVQGQ